MVACEFKILTMIIGLMKGERSTILTQVTRVVSQVKMEIRVVVKKSVNVNVNADEVLK